MAYSGQLSNTLANSAAVILRYKGPPTGIFLPDPGTFDDWLGRATRATWLTMSGQLRELRGELRMPRLDLAFAAELRDPLGALGATAAFRPGEADFSRMTDPPAPLFVSSFVHQTVVKVDEAGTRAAATSTITMPGSAPSAFRMTVDRPFFFTIHGADAQDLLFLGAVRDL